MLASPSDSKHRFRPSLRIRNEFGGSLSPAQLSGLFDLLDDVDAADFWVGWWSGWTNLDEFDEVLGPSAEFITLEHASDLEWRVWQTDRNLALAATTRFHLSPGLVLPRSTAGWVLFTGPTDAYSYVYPEATRDEG